MWFQVNQKGFGSQFPKPLLSNPVLDRLQINVWFLAIFPLLMADCKNLFSGIDQAVKNHGDHAHKKYTGEHFVSPGGI